MALNDSKLTSAIKFTLSELARHGDNVSNLPIPLRIVVIVHAAQGVIDNGGLQYFFESDFPGAPPYDLFVDAYNEIGATAAAQVLSQAAALFPFPQPNKEMKKRRDFMNSFDDEDGDPVNSPFEPLTRLLCGNKEVWAKLESYVFANANAFGN